MKLPINTTKTLFHWEKKVKKPSGEQQLLFLNVLIKNIGLILQVF